MSEGVYSFSWTCQEEERLWKIKIVVGENQWVVGILNSGWTMSDHPLLFIASLNSQMIVCWYLEQQVYDWVEHPSQATSCTIHV